jgi:hypothetical protein
MKKIGSGLVAITIVAIAALATSGTAEARWGGGWHGGWWGPGPFVGGVVAGAVVGSALAAPYGYYGPYPYRPCAWRTVWNGYRWVRACY